MKRYETLPKEHTDLAREAAEKSIVLLKNKDNLLPIAKDKKIAAIRGMSEINKLDGYSERFKNVVRIEEVA